MHRKEKRLTAHDEACNPLADSPHALRDLRPKCLNCPREIVAHNTAICGRVERTFKGLPYLMNKITMGL